MTLTALPEAGQMFLGWSGAAAGTNNPILLTMNSNTLITANYSRRAQLMIPDCFGYRIDGGFRLLLDGEVGRRYAIEKSVDLQQWSSLGTLTNGTGQIQIDLPRSTNSNLEFYRSLLVFP